MAGFLKTLVPKRFRKEGVAIPVVRLHGAIMAGGSQFRPGLSLATTAGLIEKAFAFEAPAVAVEDADAEDPQAPLLRHVTRLGPLERTETVKQPDGRITEEDHPL